MTLVKRIRAWLELLRAPNLMTVPGDPIAGFLLSGGAAVSGLTHVMPVMLSSVCLYSFGLIMNDLADVETDRRERPMRPLPSGRISLSAGRLAAVFFLVWGLTMAWMTGRDTGIVAVALALAIVCYNVLLKNRPVSGPLSMGSCRGLSMMMGAAAGGGVDLRVALGIAGLTLYVAGFSAIAQGEMKRTSVGMRRWLPAFILVVMFTSLFAVSSGAVLEKSLLIKAAFPAMLAIALAVLCGKRAKCGADIPGVIGGFIANLMLVQAALCTLSGVAGQVAGAIIACMIPVFLLLSIKFYNS